MNIEPQQLAENAQQVAAILKQLSNPYRLMILCCLSENELTVGDLNQQIDLENSQLYACGSNNMINSAKELFFKNNLKENNFFSDAFVQTN